MIPLTDPSWQSLSWQEQVKTAVRDIHQLVDALDLPPQPHFSDFPIFVPAAYLSRIEPGNPDDPLLKQVISTPEELKPAPGYQQEPLQEQQFHQGHGLIQKYQKRVLVITTGACAIHCRYCFRRHFDYDATQPDTTDWVQVMDYLRRSEDVQEVILSGGDPLMLPDRRLAQVMDQLAEIPHITTLRFHTRMPVVIPARVTKQFLGLLTSTRLKTVMVMHINHANEIDQEVIEAMNTLKQTGAVLLNQSVLLRGVNDSAEALTSLSHRLFAADILPYYLHQLDKVTGAAHFEVGDDEAHDLMEQIRSLLPGYLVPRLVREVVGATAKQPLIFKG